MSRAARQSKAAAAAGKTRSKGAGRPWSATPIGPLYPAGWVLVAFFVVVIAYNLLDSESESERVSGVIADRRPNVGTKGTSRWLCTVRTVDDVAFTAPCDANTVIGTTTRVCRRTRVWSGVRTYAMGAC